MSAITFPNSPSAGEQHTINGITYTFTDGTWVAVGQSNFYTLPIATPTVLGGVKSGGTGIQIANDGVISIATGSTFDTNDVDSHLNQSNPTGGHVLSWSGTDYAWVAQTTDTVYANTDVDAHLNQSNPTTGYVLSWNGSDYAWDDVRSLPVNTQSTYTIQTSDTGKMVKASGNITVSSANVLSEGDIVTIYNSTAGDINIERSSTDMYLVGDSTSQNRVLAQKGIATLVCVGTNEYVLMGGGIT